MTQLEFQFVGFDLARFEPPDLFRDGLPHAGRGDLPPGIRIVGDLLLGIAQHRLPARRQIGLVLLDAPVVEAFVGAAHGELETLLALPQRRLRRSPRGDVFDDQKNERRLADQPRRGPCRHGGAVPGDKGALGGVAVPDAATQRLAIRKDGGAAVLVNEREPFEADYLVCGIAEQGAKTGVGAQDFSIEPDMRHADVRLLERRRE